MGGLGWDDRGKDDEAAHAGCEAAGAEREAAAGDGEAGKGLKEL